MTRKIAVLGLGGTIAMGVGDRGLTPAMTISEILSSVVTGGEDVSFISRDILSIASASIRHQDLTVIAAVMDELSSDGVEGVVIVQGTDTIEETAFAVELLCAPKLTIAFTGALRAASQFGADGPANLAAAIQVALHWPDHAGVLVVLNDEVHAARHVRKMHTTALSAFSSGDFGLVGRMHEGQLRLFRGTLPGLGRHAVGSGGPWPKVALQVVGLNQEPDLLEGLPRLGYAGCVLEAMGSGHVPETLVPVIQSLTTNMPVVLCSRAHAGRVCERTYGYPGSETDLLRRGVLSGGGLSGLKARIALALCVAAHGRDAASAFAEITALV